MPEHADVLTAVPQVAGGSGLRNQYAYENDRIGCLTAWSKRYGDVFGYGPATVVVNHPDLIHQVLARTNREFSATVPMVEHQQTAAENLDAWMRGRRQGGRGIHPDLIAQCDDRLDRALATAVTALPARGMDLAAACERICGRAIIDVCLGGEAPAFYERTARASDDILAVSRTLDTPPWGAKRRYRRAVAAERDLTARLGGVLERLRARPGDPPRTSLVDALLAHPDRLPDQVITAVLRVTLIGGHGTPGTALAWCVREMSQRPELLARLSDEARAAPAPAAAADLPYTTAFVKEMLRFYPPTWLLARDVAEPVALCGRRLEPGQRVLFSPYLLHHDERWWDTPAEIRPERWLGEEKPFAPHAYFPFGAGPRVCVGSLLGLTVLVRAVALLAKGFELDVDGPADAAPRPDILLAPPRSRVRYVALTSRNAGRE
ncbi:unspecific monooxygenase [Amycolatopsis xylanica]|uniref:Unspecific monooxygenase n=1 Tax=Amycolatopsis xylanica TaxID=589385 RepID=A0A1H3T828_9PSEU|nr:cytochrome P450 [Amycolatopsis xylanica]SDZ46493.1 unspecific monooxygenase [Amycolatopsis xylanica]